MFLDWLVDLFARFEHLRFLLKFPATNNNEVLFQLAHVPVGDRMLFKHHRRHYSVLQVGMDVTFCGVLLGTPGSQRICFSKQKNREFKLKYLKKLFDTRNILCLQEVRGKDKYLQAIQVLSLRYFLFFYT